MTDDATVDALAEWGDTWFGGSDRWPPALAGAARACLALEGPGALTWGPDFRLLYNRAYASLLEEQHPGARGRPAWEAAASMWSVVGPMLHRVRTTGQPERGDRATLTRDTVNGPRTHWYSWTYSPVWSQDRVEGVFAVVRDDTTAELTAHHDHARSRARQVAATADVRGGLRELVHELGEMPDVRFAVCHLLEPDGSWSRLAQAGPELRRPTAASLLAHVERTGRWPTPTTTLRRDTTAPSLVRSPNGETRGLRASWTGVATVAERVVAVTVGFDPRVGDSGRHRPLVEDLVRELSRRGP